MQRFIFVFLLVFVANSRDFTSRREQDPSAAGVLPETGQVVVPAGPNYYEPDSGHILIPIQPDSVLDTTTGRVLRAPPNYRDR